MSIFDSGRVRPWIECPAGAPFAATRAAGLGKVRLMLLQSPIFHSNQYHAAAACEHCGGLVRHETWCITRSSVVYYAYEAALDPEKLSLADRLILHALGVQWVENHGPGTCQVSNTRKP
jgi:hypothetical protein